MEKELSIDASLLDSNIENLPGQVSNDYPVENLVPETSCNRIEKHESVNEKKNIVKQNLELVPRKDLRNVKNCNTSVSDGSKNFYNSILHNQVNKDHDLNKKELKPLELFDNNNENQTLVKTTSNTNTGSIVNSNNVSLPIGGNCVEYIMLKKGTRNGKPKLYDSLGFSYSIYSRQLDVIKWLCIKRSGTVNCQATITEIGNCYNRNKNHCHQGDSDSFDTAAIELNSEENKDKLTKLDDDSQSLKFLDKPVKKCSKIDSPRLFDYKEVCSSNSANDPIISKLILPSEIEEEKPQSSKSIHIAFKDANDTKVYNSTDLVFNDCNDISIDNVSRNTSVSPQFISNPVIEESFGNLGYIEKLNNTSKLRSTCDNYKKSDDSLNNIACRKVTSMKGKNIGANQLEKIDSQLGLAGGPSSIGNSSTKSNYLLSGNKKTSYVILKNGTYAGNQKLIDSFGFSYSRGSLLTGSRNKIGKWLCTKRSKLNNCPATILEISKNVYKRNKDHNHSENTNAYIAAVKLQKEENLNIRNLKVKPKALVAKNRASRSKLNFNSSKNGLGLVKSNVQQSIAIQKSKLSFITLQAKGGKKDDSFLIEKLNGYCYKLAKVNGKMKIWKCFQSGTLVKCRAFIKQVGKSFVQSHFKHHHPSSSEDIKAVKKLSISKPAKKCGKAINLKFKDQDSSAGSGKLFDSICFSKSICMESNENNIGGHDILENNFIHENEFDNIVLSREVEVDLSKLFISISHIGLSHNMNLDLYLEACKTFFDELHLNHFPNNLPSKEWVCKFIRRHPVLSSMVSERLKIYGDNQNLESLTIIFNNLLKACKETFNIDATKYMTVQNSDKIFCMDVIELVINLTKLVVTLEMKNFKTLEKGQRTMTVLCCVNCFGYSIRPLIINKGSVLSKYDSYEDVDGTYNKSYSSSGFLTQEVFHEWLISFDHEIDSKNLQRPIVLYLNGNFPCISYKSIEFARKKNILLYCTPPNLSGSVHPFRFKIYNELKINYLRKFENALNNDSTELPRNQFPYIFMKAYEETDMFTLAKNAFAHCGICPYSMEVFCSTIGEKERLYGDSIKIDSHFERLQDTMEQKHYVSQSYDFTNEKNSFKASEEVSVICDDVTPLLGNSVCKNKEIKNLSISKSPRVISKIKKRSSFRSSLDNEKKSTKFKKLDFHIQNNESSIEGSIKTDILTCSGRSKLTNNVSNHAKTEDNMMIDNHQILKKVGKNKVRKEITNDSSKFQEVAKVLIENDKFQMPNCRRRSSLRLSNMAYKPHLSSSDISEIKPVAFSKMKLDSNCYETSPLQSKCSVTDNNIEIECINSEEKKNIVHLESHPNYLAASEVINKINSSCITIGNTISNQPPQSLYVSKCNKLINSSEVGVGNCINLTATKSNYDTNNVFNKGEVGQLETVQLPLKKYSNDAEAVTLTSSKFSKELITEDAGLKGLKEGYDHALHNIEELFESIIDPFVIKIYRQKFEDNIYYRDTTFLLWRSLQLLKCHSPDLLPE